MGLDTAGLPPLTAERLVTTWTLDAVVTGAAILAVLWQLRAAGRLRRRGRRWPPGRTLSFQAGMLTLVLAADSAMGAYDTTLFSAHTLQHVVLGMLAPILLAMAAPITLLLQTTSRWRKRALLRVLHSHPARWASRPAAGWVLFGGGIFAVYFSPLFEFSLRNDFVHQLVHLHLLVAGCVFFFPLVGVDRLPGRPSAPVRLLSLLLAVPLHAFVGLALVSSRSPLAPSWSLPAWVDVIADQRTGGGIMWVAGEMITLVALMVAANQWWHEDARHARRADRRMTRS